MLPITTRIHPRDRATIWSKEWRVQNLYPIRTEAATLAKMSFEKKPVQRRLFGFMSAKGFRGMRIVILKSRKLGVSTEFEVVYLDDTLFTKNRQSLILADNRENLDKLFEIVRIAYNNMPSKMRLADGRIWEKPKAYYDNANELSFRDLNSNIYVALKNRGGTNHNLHVTEVATIKNVDDLKGTIASVPNREFGSNISFESTANGIGGEFHERWTESVSKVNGYDPFFFAWWMDPKNASDPPRDWRPGEREMKVVEQVASQFGRVLDWRQLWWWRTMSHEMKKLMPQEHPSFADEAFMTSDWMVFDGVTLNATMTRAPSRVWRKVLVWKEPEPGHTYTLGADPAEGVGGDNSAIEVVDDATGEQVAEYASDTIPPARFALVIARVGAYYNGALAAVERNNHGHTVLEKLRGVYDNIFMQMTEDQKTKTRTKKMGWLTTGANRDMLIDDLVEAADNGAFTPASAMLKGEMQTFITDKSGKREAKQGCKDDRVMALAIARKVSAMPKASFGVYDLG